MNEYIKHLFTCARGHVYELRLCDTMLSEDRFALCQQAAAKMDSTENLSESEYESE